MQDLFELLRNYNFGSTLVHVLSRHGRKVRRWSEFFLILQIYEFQHYTALTSQIRNAQWIETDLVENLFVIVSRIKLFLHSKDHSVGNQIIKFHSIFCTFRFEPIPIAAPSIFCNSKLITFYFLHILFSAHSIFCTFHFLPIPVFAHSSCCPFRFPHIPFSAHSFRAHSHSMLRSNFNKRSKVRPMTTAASKVIP